MKSLTNDDLQAAQDRYDERQQPEVTPPDAGIHYVEDLENSLKPCVYCGHKEPEFSNLRGYIRAICPNCGSASQGFVRINNGHAQYKAAFDAWNLQWERHEAVRRFLDAYDSAHGSEGISEFSEHFASLKTLFAK